MLAESMSTTRAPREQQQRRRPPRPTRRPVQLEIGFRTRGGPREGAGRKPVGPHRAGLPHVAREPFSRRSLLHVTLKVAPAVWNLRSRRSFRRITAALAGGAERFDTRVLRFSVQGNHIHLLVEAPDAVALSRALKGLGVRLARRLNAMMARRGRVIGDRYHARRLRTPSEVRRVIDYIRDNHRRHMAQRGLVLAAGVDPFSSDAPLGPVLPRPLTWLARVGWQRGRTGPSSLQDDAQPP